MPTVRAEYGPTLPELLGARRWRVVRVLVIVAAIAIGVLLLFRPGAEQRIAFDVRGVAGPSASFEYQAPLRRAGPATVSHYRGDTFVESMRVRALALPAYRGDPGGELPIIADRLQRALAARHPGFELVEEGRARIKSNPAYAFSWTAPGRNRRIFGHEYLIVHQDAVAPRVGFHLELRGTYLSNVSTPEDVGRVGPLRLALHTFTFDGP